MSPSFRARWLAGAAALLPLLAAPHTALAQADTGADAVTTDITTVTVSARKREENEQLVPISISAYSQADLDQLHIQTLQDLNAFAPSLTVEPSTFRQDTLNITIRGQRNFDSSGQGGNPGLSFDTASAVYVDGVYYARAIGLTGALFDMSSVDVLKGPQGTLVGRNTTGGALLLQTNAPILSEYGGYLKMQGGDYDQYTLQGAVNIPLTDNLFFRAAISAQGNKGYIKNYFTDPASGFSNTQPGEGTQKLAGRFSLKWVPDDDFSLLLRADLSEEHDTGSTYHDLGYFVGTTLATGNKPSACNIPGACVGFTDLLGHPVAAYYTNTTGTPSGVNTAPAAYNTLLNSVAREQTDGFWSTEQTLSNADVGHYHTVSALADKSIDDIDIKWLAAYRWFDSVGQSNSRGLSYDTTNFAFGMPHYQSWESELTVNGTALDDRLKWTTGMFFFEENSPNDGGFEYLFLPSAGSAPTAASGKQITVTDWSNNGERNTSYAAYAQATYNVTDDTRLTAGVRYTIDQRAAYIGTQTIRTPATVTTNNPVVNGVYNPAGFTYQGITYSGQTDVCAITSLTGVALPQSQCGLTVSKTFDRATWTLAVDHDLFDQTMVYFTSRSGYRSGGINTQAVNPAYMVASPESVLDFELGAKSDWMLWDIPVRTNVDGYETQYSNIQTAVTMPNITLATGPGGVGTCTQALFSAGQCVGTQNANVTLNGKSARVWGLEWDITAKPIPQLTINWAGSYLDARYTDFSIVAPPDYLLPNGTNNFSGTPFPLPSWQTNITASYAFGLHAIGDLPVKDLVLTAHYSWQGRYLANLQGYNASQQTSPYGLLNLQLNLLGIGGSAFDAAIFVNNATNQKACGSEYVGVLNSAPNATFGIAGTSGVLQCVPLPPRMAGLSLIYRF